MAYPQPLIIPPLSTPHKQTFIILHGRGSSAEKFAPPLLSTEFTLPSPSPTISSPEKKSSPQPSRSTPCTPSPTSSQAAYINTTGREGVTLQSVFPNAKFIFPTAPRTRAALYKRSKTNQWFDNWDLDAAETDTREELQAPGLNSTVSFLHGLIKNEAAWLPDLGGAGDVILWGLSQGCAASLVSLLLWEGDSERLGAVVGMCGWLPYSGRLKGEMMELGIGKKDRSKDKEGNNDDDDDDEEFDPFDRGIHSDGSDDGDPFDRSASRGKDSEERESDPAMRAINWLKEELQLGLDKKEEGETKLNKLEFKKVPVFLGHGVEDDKVNVVLGRAAFSCLRELGVERAEWREYEGLGHWYSSEMLSDIVCWIRREVGWEGAFS